MPNRAISFKIFFFPPIRGILTPLFIVFVLSISGKVFGQHLVKNNAFKAGEKLVYNVSYSSFLGNFDAGKATIEVKESNCPDSVGYRPCYYMVGSGKTNSLFDILYKVRDRFESYIDQKTLLPIKFIRKTQEGDYQFNDSVYFDRKEKVIKSRRAIKSAPQGAHDIISAVFFMRTLSLDDFLPDSSYLINFYLDDSVYFSEVKYVGRGLLKTEWGWLPCLKVKPMMATGEVFSKKYPMSVWITDDENHIPLMAESEIIVGSVRMILVDFKGLKNPFIKPVKRKNVK
jgi:hypothetical protein